MNRVDSGTPRQIDSFALMELFASEAHESMKSGAAAKDANFEAESQLRERAVCERERAAASELASGVVSGASMALSGVTGLLGVNAKPRVTEGFQKAIEGMGNVYASTLTYDQRSHENNAARLDNKARTAGKAGDDAREATSEFRRLRDGQIDAMKKVADEEYRTRQQIIRG